MSKFTPFISTHRKPLQELLKQSENDFIWQDHHTEAFNTSKNDKCKNVTLKYFDSSVAIYVECDASKKGIVVVMPQPDSAMEKLVFYASKILTSTGSNYSNIERDAGHGI